MTENEQKQPAKLRSTAEADETLIDPEEDYLRKYQYRKQAKFGSANSDPQPGSKAEVMKKQLLSQPRVRGMQVWTQK